MNQGGDTFVVQASPRYGILGVNSLGERANASVVISGGQVILRTHQALWCIGRPKQTDRVFARNAAGDVVCIDARPEAARADRATATVVYQNDASIFPNPERGFYEHIQPAGGGTPGNQEIPHPPLVAAELAGR